MRNSSTESVLAVIVSEQDLCTDFCLRSTISRWDCRLHRQASTAEVGQPMETDERLETGTALVVRGAVDCQIAGNMLLTQDITFANEHSKSPQHTNTYDCEIVEIQRVL